jgi:CubicO group peptidase (beta-lactamase class C family)
VAELNRDLLRDAAGYVDRWLAYQQRFHEIPAVTVALLHGDELLLSTGYGFANLEERTPVTPAHIFRVASHSKWFTATAVMQLKERGKLRLDDPLRTYIPWLRDPIAAVTVRETLNHAGGITRDGYDNDHWQLEHPFPDADQLRRLVEDGGDVLPANTILKYSNIGYSLLGLVVEAAGGMPYNRYMQQEVVNRLGLRDTGPETNAEARPRMVTGYSPRGLLLPRVPLPDADTRAMSAATGFYSTAEDLVRFAAAHFPGTDTLIGDESKREMQRPYWQVEDVDSYGLGMEVMTVGDRRVAGHGGSFPGHSTRTGIDAEGKLAISLLTNESSGRARDLSRSVWRLIDLALEQEPAENARALDRYAGRFASPWGFTDIVRLGGTLFTIGPDAPDPVSSAAKLEVVDENTLRIEEKAGYGSPGEYVRYSWNADGTLDKIVFAGRTQHPIGTLEDYLERRREELSQAEGA